MLGAGVGDVAGPVISWWMDVAVWQAQSTMLLNFPQAVATCGQFWKRVQSGNKHHAAGWPQMRQGLHRWDLLSVARALMARPIW